MSGKRTDGWRDDDRLRLECGVFGVFDAPDAAHLTALGLHALQHRGEEACGIAAFDGNKFHTERLMGRGDQDPVRLGDLLTQPSDRRVGGRGVEVGVVGGQLP